MLCLAVRCFVAGEHLGFHIWGHAMATLCCMSYKEHKHSWNVQVMIPQGTEFSSAGLSWALVAWRSVVEARCISCYMLVKVMAQPPTPSRLLVSLTARENVVSGVRSHPHNPHGVENLPAQCLASTFTYCLTPVERTFWVQIPPVFSLHVFFSSYKSTQELGSLKRRVLAVPRAGSLLWPESQDVAWVVGITQGKFSPLQDWLLWHFVEHCIRNYWCKSNLHSALCLIKAFLTGTLCVWHEYGWFGLHEPKKSLFIQWR